MRLQLNEKHWMLGGLLIDELAHPTCFIASKVTGYGKTMSFAAAVNMGPSMIFGFTEKFWPKTLEAELGPGPRDSDKINKNYVELIAVLVAIEMASPVEWSSGNVTIHIDNEHIIKCKS